MYAVILAGGFGTRLRSAVADVPKPLAPIAGKPFLAWLVGVLAQQGIEGITLSVHHEWKKIRSYFDGHPVSVPLQYAIEEMPLGTGGAIKYAFMRYPQDEPVLVLNGDSFVSMDYAALLVQHTSANAELTMVLQEVADSGRYGLVEAQGGIITAFADGVPAKAGLINAGIYLMHPAIFNEPGLPEAFSFERDFLPSRLGRLRPRAVINKGYFIDIGIPEDYRRACNELPEAIKNPIF
jgi:D-glycero-alpha-D-manno-heptose 1-phosphate guanylyltransferase